MIAAEDLRAIAGRKARAEIVAGLAAGLAEYGADFGLQRPEILAQFLAQIGHESGRFRFLEEVWGPTMAQARYDARTDLGNTPAADGDGYLYRGRGLIQLTGAANVGAFSVWARARFADAPDFAAEPERLAEFPWALLSALFFWQERRLGSLAAKGELTAITRAVNGGLNGLSERTNLYVRTALTLLGQPLKRGALKRFQEEHGLAADDVAGPKTLAELHRALKALPDLSPGTAGAAGPVGFGWDLAILAALTLAALAAAVFISGGELK
ncbi:glycoside hydrolase family 19 protein [Afifella sp. IM 167]|uniref:glycoside hydrolase family 19 protein n=1 Tax=Afifella sp. IM 167 TaxID=2033586 RepID=UPI001CCC93E9|nr:glycoside hydrolase family 19 protein [Afifella sp. IM 167]MBZ8133917.1 peptidoglycan-binding protein [Afifella sp. IM 167]